MGYSVLPETTLTAIVRDEIMNPAGGIKRYLMAILPHVMYAVVVDTGSVDGTRDVLSDLQKEFPHLSVYDRKFDNFAPSRNFSLSKVRTKRALVLDADELLTHEDCRIMAEFMERNPVWGYWFVFRNIYPNGAEYRTVEEVSNPRLFEVEGVEYRKGHIFGSSEDMSFSLSVCDALDAPVEIKHFLPQKEAKNRKGSNWYLKGEFLQMQPTEAAKRDGWKDFNHGRNLFE